MEENRSYGLEEISLIEGGMICEIQPLVVATIIHAYLHKGKNIPSVVGVILGEASTHIMDARMCYLVPFTIIDDKINLNINFNQQMYKLHTSASPKDQIIGWFSSDPAITKESVFLHYHFKKFAEEKSSSTGQFVFLTFDPSLKNDQISIHAYQERSIAPLANVLHAFTQIPVHIVKSNPEKNGMDTVSYGQEFFDPLGLIMKSEEEMEEGMNGAQNKGGIPQKSLSSNLQLFKQTLHHLVCMIDKCIDYAKEAAIGEREGKENILHNMEEALTLMKATQIDDLEKFVATTYNDMLAISFVSTVIQSQILLSEKLFKLET